MIERNKLNMNEKSLKECKHARNLLDKDSRNNNNNFGYNNNYFINFSWNNNLE